MTSRVCVMTLLAALALTTLAQAQTFTTLYNFSGGSDGGTPYASVIQDPAGNLYGTTNAGGGNSCNGGCGVVFELNSSGVETVLHSFSGSDGQQSYTGLIGDSNGNGYGTTSGGGSSGNGTVFKIDATGKFTVLYSFAGGTSDGCQPYQGLVRDNAGNLYGTTTFCGTSNMGTIYKLDPAGNETILHNFGGSTSDGAYPFYGHLLADKSGVLYGVTEQGGSNGAGVLYGLSSQKFVVLHSFVGGTSDGCYPEGSVVEDQNGNLYGTASQCGSNGVGTIWKVSKNGNQTTLHNFAGGTSDGCFPEAGVTGPVKGKVYGSVGFCGAQNSGALYELSSNGTFALLHSFDGSDGNRPQGEVLLTSKGTLFGTTLSGGTDNAGTVWSYVP